MSEPASGSPLTRELLRLSAEVQGLALSDRDLDTLLPLLRATRALIDDMSAIPLDDVEPTSLYHMG